MSVAREPMLIIQQAALIQAALIAFAVLAVAVMLMPEARRRLCATAARMAAARLRRTRRATEVADVRRYADEVAVAARRATITAERRHDEWKRAERECAAAWQAYEAADEAARVAAQAAMYSLPVQTAEEHAANWRRVCDAATGAYRRGELSVEQLRDLVGQRDSWGAQRNRYEQEARLRRAVREKLLAAYRTGSEMERAARNAADMAAAAKRSLDAEAAAAAERAAVVGSGRAVRIPRQRPARPAVARSASASASATATATALLAGPAAGL
ncbi:hypothetical protein HC028_22810 [Planosporangium flavigriseum]|uniref:Uncharacterized protein n=1 Tax=Planosporangium flavigriseum TaxID=373681 RepID=A0A8J3PR56_9ACTN|nr:hypothetical protein [Planosporangium flavigriseum]NJC67310.1 hypothetical protein [Planosporangium flavigriseum]GIG76781.1 hypothetical protein Pfl04_51850 [Planosporangium flavigriseum]